MKLRVLLAVLFVAGLAASLAFAASPKPPKPQKPGARTASTTTTTTSKKPKCQQVELKGNATAGSVTFTVLKANKRGRNLVGTPVTLVVPAGAKVKAKACTDAGGALTLRDLHVKAKPAKQ
jgi:heme-binding NEAT domain protein